MQTSSSHTLILVHSKIPGAVLNLHLGTPGLGPGIPNDSPKFGRFSRFGWLQVVRQGSGRSLLSVAHHWRLNVTKRARSQAGGIG